MDNYTVVQRKTIAIERGIRGYYKLSKVELIHALEATRLVEQKSNIFHESIPNDPTPILQQHLEGHQIFTTKVKQNTKNYLLMVCKRLKIFVNGC